MEWYLGALTKFDDYSGRARPKEYWMFQLFNLLILVGLIIFETTLGISHTSYDGKYEPGIIFTLYAFVMVLPGLAVTVRRLHDVGKSGWFLLVSLIPIIGPVWVWILMMTDGQPGSNSYGENPKETALAGSASVQKLASLCIENDNTPSEDEIQNTLDDIKFKYNPLNETAFKLSSDLVSHALDSRKANIMKRFAEPIDSAAGYQVFLEFLFFYLYQFDKCATLLLSFTNKTQLIESVWSKVLDQIICNSLITLDKNQLEAELEKSYDATRKYYEIFEASQTNPSEKTVYHELGQRISNNVSYLIDSQSVADLAYSTIEKLQFSKRILKLANAWN